VEPLQLKGRFLALPANIRLAWKLLVVTNALAYNKGMLFATIKSEGPRDHSHIENLK
jgi:hypothetical protein